MRSFGLAKDTITNEPSREDQNNNGTSKGSIPLHNYMQETEPTTNFLNTICAPSLWGCSEKLGASWQPLRSMSREESAYAGYQQAMEEEFGDLLWYFTALCRRLDVGIDNVLAEASDHSKPIVVDAAETLLDLGKVTAALLGIKSKSSNEQTYNLLRTFSDRYLQALQAANVSFSKIAHMNIEKTQGRFLDPDMSILPTFDSDLPNEERLPDNFQIKITQRKSGQSYLQWNEVFIGDPLTDNIADSDGYRFHDVFHLSHAAILHWSPTFRALIKQKRKSVPKLDEAQDGGRAIVVEEGLTAWIFSCAKNLDFFKGQNSVSFDLLKTVQQFVRGYEVEACPLKLWERAILEGYEVFRLVRDNNGGVVVGDRKARTIDYKSIDEE